MRARHRARAVTRCAFGLVKPEDGYSCLSSLVEQTFHLVTLNEGLTAGLAQSKAHALARSNKEEPIFLPR